MYSAGHNYKTDRFWPQISSEGYLRSGESEE